MLVLSVENGVLGILSLLIVSSLILLHFLLFREYARREKVQIQKLKDFENLVNAEIQRSFSLSKKSQLIQENETKTDEMLEIIKLQVEGMKVNQSQEKQD